MILTGEFGRAARLPATRALAHQLGVSRNIVLLAYRHLLREGYAGGRTGSGTYVALELPDAIVLASPPGRARTPVPAAPRLSAFARRLTTRPLARTDGSARPAVRYDFRYGMPVAAAFPFTLWRKLVAAQARVASVESLRAGRPEGYRPLREAIADYLRRSRAVQCDADQVIVTSGSQQALDLAARILVDAGERVVLKEPHYPGAREAFHGAGARITAVPVDTEGLEVARLGRVARGARVVCVTPSHQFPTGVVMSLARRLALLRWAEDTGAWIVEDDYETEFRYERRPVEAIQGLDRRGRVIYVGTLSKALFPALRLGYVVVPRTLIDPFRAAKWVADRQTSTFFQEVVAGLIGDGDLERHVRRARTLLAGRRRALLEAITTHLGHAVEISGSDAGLHLVLWIRGMRIGRALETLISRAARADVGVYSVAPFYVTPPRRAGLFLGYAGLDESEIGAGIERLAGVLRGIRADG